MLAQVVMTVFSRLNTLDMSDDTGEEEMSTSKTAKPSENGEQIAILQQEETLSDTDVARSVGYDAESISEDASDEGRGDRLTRIRAPCRPFGVPVMQKIYRFLFSLINPNSSVPGGRQAGVQKRILGRTCPLRKGDRPVHCDRTNKQTILLSFPVLIVS